MDVTTPAPDPVSALLDFAGPPAEFWRGWSETCRTELQGQLAVLYVRPVAGPADDLAGWTVLAVVPEAAAAGAPPLASAVDAALVAEALRNRVASGPARQGPWTVRLIAVRPEDADQELLLSVHVPAAVRGDLTVHRLGLLAMVPRIFELSRERRRQRRDIARQRAMLEVLWRVLETERFDQATLAFVNELCDRFGCEQVSLLWTGRVGLQVKAVSHADRLERRTDLVELVEEAGQEAIAQWREIAYPDDADATVHAHRAYAEASRPGHLLSVPLVIRDVAVGAIVLERQAAGFSKSERWALRILADQVARPLRDLHRLQRPLHRRLAREVGRSLPAPLRATTREGRWLALALVAAAIGVLFVPVPYRVDTAVQIKTDRIAFVGAPFDGFIETASVVLGDTVRAGDPLFALATQELQLERISHLADIAQYAREAEKRLAANQLVEMRIAEAQVAQTQAKLGQVEYRLDAAAVTAPIDGIVVDGEPGKNLGGAVKRGETIVKVAAVSGLHAELSIDERDVQRIAPGMTADVSLVADPNTSWTVRIVRLVPAAAIKDGVNTFPARAEFLDGHPDWWRPGMSGVAKIDVGLRPIAWIALHRLIDYLRLTLWI